MVAGEFVPYVALPHVNLEQYNNVKFITDFGPVNGIPGVWAVDPADYDDPEAFHERVFGSVTRHTIPGSTFAVDVDEISYYAQVNFAAGGLHGNLGMKAVETTLTVHQNIAGPSKPYGNTAVDTGDVVTKREYTDYLPSVNLAYDFTDSLILRTAYHETMVPLDLNQWGDGLTLNTVIDSDPNSPTFNQFIVSSGSLNGNPQLDPWRSSNYDISLEWYLGSASMLSAGLFRVEVESFPEGTTQTMPQPDADGVVRREVPVSLSIQGDGGTLEGLELNAKFAFSDLMDEGFFSNFGVDTNYTYSPSEGGDNDIFGEPNPFTDNSEHQFNLVGWYENDRFSTRLAYNYRSERLSTLNGAAWGVLNVYQKDAAYLDISTAYDITDELSVYLQGSNITGEYEEYYLGAEEQYGFQNYYEPRYTLGIRARF